MWMPDLPADEVPAEDWAEQQVDDAADPDVPLEAGEITTPISTPEANEADVVEQETEVLVDDEP